MKDRRNNMEIMDVLSSIRRLVSEDRKAAAAPVAPAEAAEAAPREEPPLRRPPEHRFVLTEALRVSEDVEIEESLPEDPAVVGAGDDVASLEDTIAELEAAVAGLSAGFEPDAGELHENMAAEPASDWVAEDIIRRRPEMAQVLDRDDLRADDEHIVGPAAGASVAAGLEAAMSAQPRTARLTPTAPTIPAGEADLDDVPAIGESGGGRLHFSSSAARRPLSLRADPSDADEAPVTTEAAAFPNDRPTEAPEAVFEAHSTDADEGVAVAADMVDEGGPSGQDASDLFNPLADTDLDMDVLRDLVSEIVRDELRGALGDKITRNLRTMIRREIERALEAQGLKRS